LSAQIRKLEERLNVEVLPKILAEVHERYPRLEVKSAEIWWGRDAVTSGLADIAIIRGPVPEDAEITGATLMESRIGVVIGSDHPLAGEETVAVADVDGALEIPARRFSPGFHDAILEVMHSRGFTGEVSEYENLGARFLLDDEAACAHIVSGTAFGIGFEGQYSVLPPELVWVPVGPPLYVPMNICFREAGDPQCATSSRARSMSRYARTGCFRRYAEQTRR
jgi:DNA-binding transcriptional LysR family regulator